MMLQSQNAPINKLSCSKARKTQQICHYKHTRKNSELLLLFNTGVSFSLRNNFAKSGSFAKVSVPIHNYNSLLGRDWKWQLSSYLRPSGACNSKILTCIIQFIIGLVVFFFCMAECSDCCHCYNMLISQLITYNSFLFGFALSKTHLIQGALYLTLTRLVSWVFSRSVCA